MCERMIPKGIFTMNNKILTYITLVCSLIILPVCYSLTGGGNNNQHTWRTYHYRSAGVNDDIVETNLNSTKLVSEVQSFNNETNSMSGTTSLPQVPGPQSLPTINGTLNGPHLVVSGRLVRPQQHHSAIIAQPQPLIAQPITNFRTSSNATTQMRGPSYYYGTPLVVNHTIPIPHTPSNWRMASTPSILHGQSQPILRQFPANILGQNTSQIVQPAQQFINSTISAISSHMTGQSGQKPQDQSLPASSSSTAATTSKTLVSNPSELPINQTNLPQPSATIAAREDDDDQQEDLIADGSHRSLFSDLGSSLFGGKKLLVQEEVDEYEEPKLAKGGKKEKLLAKLGAKKGSKVEVGYEDEYGAEEVLVKPVKEKKIKLKPKLKGKEKIVLPAEEYGGGGYEHEPSYGGGYGAPAPVYPQAAAYPTPAAYPSAYPVDPYPKGKFVPQYRQSNTNTTVITNGTLVNPNSTDLNNNSTLSLTRSASPNKIIMSGYLAQDTSIKSQDNLRSSDPYSASAVAVQLGALAAAAYPPPPSLALASEYGAAALVPSAYGAPAAAPAYAAPAYGAPAYGGDYGAAAAAPAYPAPAPAYGAPAYGGDYGAAAAAPAYSAPAPAYGAPAYGGDYGAAAAAPAPAYGAPAYAAPAPAYGGGYGAAAAAPAYAALAPAYGAPAYSLILGKVLDHYPTKGGGYGAPAAQYDYSLPVGVVNLYCNDPKYPCSCTLYLTEISSYNLLISGVCSGLQKEKYYMMNLYESGDITAGCNSLGLLFAPALGLGLGLESGHGGGKYGGGGYGGGGYRNHGGNLVTSLGLVKTDAHGVAFVNKLKHDNLGIGCDKYGYKSSILGKAVGLTEVLLPALSLAPGYGAPPLAALSPLVVPSYRRTLGSPLLNNVVACGVVGLAHKDNSYETRQLKARLVANAETEKQGKI